MSKNLEKVECFLRVQDVQLMREYRVDPGVVLRILGTSFAGILRRHETVGQAMSDFTEPRMVHEIKKTAELMAKERENVNSKSSNKSLRRRKKVKRKDLD